MLLGKADFIRDYHDRYREHCMGFCRKGERLHSTPKTIRKSGKLSPRSRGEGLC